MLAAARRDSKIRADEVVVWFPTYGYRSEAGWRFQLHGYVFEPETDSKKRAVALPPLVAVVEKLAGQRLDRGETRRRLTLFLADSQSHKPLAASLAQQVFRLGRTDWEGHAATWLTGNLGVNGAVAAPGAEALSALLPPADERHFSGTVNLIERTGLSIISDVDDTVRVTQVRSRRDLLDNTFSREWRAVPDVAELLTRYHKAGASVHYVSSMPWQLYPEFETLQHAAHLPQGSVHFRSLRVSQLNTFLDAEASLQHKLSHLNMILGHFPQRKFILLGDSGERDPEVYAQIYAAHPKQVVQIWIRNVSGEGADAARYAKLFSQAPREKWQVFRQASELSPVRP